MKETDNASQDARAIGEAKYGLIVHVAIYVGVNALLALINFLTSPGNPWFLWSVAGWGIGILAHAIKVLFLSRGISLKERMIQREVEKRSAEDE